MFQFTAIRIKNIKSMNPTRPERPIRMSCVTRPTSLIQVAKAQTNHNGFRSGA